MPRVALIALPIFVLLMPPVPPGAGVLNVTVTPQSLNPGQAATILVTMRAPCSQVEIDFGNGQVTLFPTSPPQFSLPYSWPTSGNYTVTATGKADCTGQASTTVNVKTRDGSNPLGDLCKAVDCGELEEMLNKPKITGILAVSKPGGVGWVKGKNFGASQGSVVANLKRFNGAAQPTPLKIENWTATLIEVKWPDDISGVTDQDTTVHVLTANQAKSNEWPLLFRAAETTSTLPQAEIKHTDCGTDSNEDQCGFTYDGDDYDAVFPLPPDVAPWPMSCDGTICGRHYNLCAAIGDDADKDVWVLPNLKNDWVYSGVEKLTWNTSGGGMSGPAGLQANMPDGPVLTITWKVTPCDDVEYDVAVRIRGPVGVPHK